jgi:DivIVA domain-containing protein
MTPQDIREAAFPVVRLGRRGVDEAEVRAFCDRVANELTRSLTERTALEAEVRRLRERVLGTRREESITPDDAHVQAVNVLTMAQRTADRYVADAQDYSRELAQDAHLRHDEILREAQVRASMILDEAHASAQAAADMVPPPQDGAGAGQRDMEAELAYLRTFSHVCRTHLRAYLESLSKSIEEWERAEEHGLMSARGASARPPAARLRAGRPPGGLGLAHRRGRRSLEEWPDLLGDGAPVACGVHLPENGEQPQVDPLDHHVRARDAGVRGYR